MRRAAVVRRQGREVGTRAIHADDEKETARSLSKASGRLDCKVVLTTAHVAKPVYAAACQAASLRGDCGFKSRRGHHRY